MIKLALSDAAFTLPYAVNNYMSALNMYSVTIVQTHWYSNSKEKFYSSKYQHL